MPMSIDLKIPAIAGVITAVVVETKSESKPNSDDTSDDGIAFSNGDGEETAYSVSTGTGTVHAFVNGVEIEHGSGVTISGNNVTFDTAPAEGASVSIIKI